jgi:tRNA (cmo5U34)-methyltransferase
VLAEKFHFDDEDEQHFQTELQLQFKRANGYTDMEISRKRTALENVLITDTFATHRARLEGIGFTPVYRWFQCFNFGALAAIKPPTSP